MKAADVMVADVVCVTPETAVQAVAEIMLRHRISGVPVVGADGRLVGMVSEGDLIRRVETGSERNRSWWLELLTPNKTLAADFVKAHARKVEDVMTRKVITATEEMTLGEIATLLEKHRIKRVPIVREGKVVGIVSRANLLQGLASRGEAPSPASSASDREIRDALLSQLNRQPWGASWRVTATVKAGIVTLWGGAASEAERKAILVTAENTPGVTAVIDNLVLYPASAD
jgi:CBS domain-containing protein